MPLKRVLKRVQDFLPFTDFRVVYMILQIIKVNPG